MVIKSSLVENLEVHMAGCELRNPPVQFRRDLWLHLGHRPTSSMSNFIGSVNSDLGNGSFRFEIRDAELVDRCSWKCSRVWKYKLTSDLREIYFFICLQWSCLKAVSVPTFVSCRRPAGLHRDERFCQVYVCMCVCVCVCVCVFCQYNYILQGWPDS